jgi:predicted NACHT family NTPase
VHGTIGYLLNTLLRRRRATRRYSRTVTTRYGAVVVPFAGDAVLQMRDVYVPLAADSGTGPADAYEQIRLATRAVVTGGPGSGKSMLLRHSMPAWAERSGPRPSLQAPIPVLLDLHRRGRKRQKA